MATPDGTTTEEVPRAPMTGELGVTGLRRAGGWVFEEFLPQLRGQKAIQVYREMAENDATIGGLLFAFDRLLRQVEWRVEPGDSSEEQRKAAEFLESCMHDMDHTWDEFISEALTMLVYGWAWHEIVYKRRGGPWEESSNARSKHSDGMVGWKRIPLRAQETWHRWVFDSKGNTIAMVQMAAPDYEQVVIPREKSLLFRPITVKNNPEGRSVLRNIYRPWYFKKRVEEFELIGVERDLAGMPIAKVPTELLSANKTSAEGVLFEKIKALVMGTRRNEYEGLVFPHEFDRATGNPIYEFELLGGGGTRQMATHQIIDRYSTEILQAVLADFIKLGHQGTGSYAMHTDKSGLFRASVNSISQSIADVLNMQAVPALFKMNNLKMEVLPKFVPNSVDPPDLGQLAQFLTAMGSVGMQVFPDPDLERFVRSAAQLPELDEQEMRGREVESRYAAITRVAQAKLDSLGVGQQALQMSMMGSQPMPGQPGAVPGQQQGQQPPGAPQGPPGVGKPPGGPAGLPAAQPPKALPPGGQAPVAKAAQEVVVDDPPPPLRVRYRRLRRDDRVLNVVEPVARAAAMQGPGVKHVLGVSGKKWVEEGRRGKS